MRKLRSKRFFVLLFALFLISVVVSFMFESFLFFFVVGFFFFCSMVVLASRLQNIRLLWPKRILLIVLSVILSIAVLELALQVGGFFWELPQEFSNKKSLEAKSSSDYTILALGESTTAGGGLDNPKWPGYLETFLNQETEYDFSVINKGVSGTTTLYILENLESNLDMYEPDIVMVMMGLNDAYSNIYFDRKLPEKTYDSERRTSVFSRFFNLKIVNLYYFLKEGFHTISAATTDVESDRRSSQNANHIGNLSVMENISDIRYYIYKERYVKANKTLQNLLKSENISDYEKSLLYSLMPRVSLMVSGSDYTNVKLDLELKEQLIDYQKKALELYSDNIEARFLLIRLAAYIGNCSYAKELMDDFSGRMSTQELAVLETAYDECLRSTGDSELYDEYLASRGFKDNISEKYNDFLDFANLSVPDNTTIKEYVTELSANETLVQLYSDHVGTSVLKEGLYSTPKRHFQLMKSFLEDRGIQFIIVQYPRRDPSCFERLFNHSVPVVSNLDFLDDGEDYWDLFIDTFADGDDYLCGNATFGHMTSKGHEKIARNAVPVVKKSLGIS